MSQVKLSKTQLAILDAMIADAQERGVTTIGANSAECWFDCILSITQTLTPTVTVTVAGAAAPHEPISVAKLVAFRKGH